MTTYWLVLFSPATWQEFLDAGGETAGFRENRWPAASQIKPGDYLLCYLTQVSRFIGVLEVVSDPYRDEERSIWQDNDFPCRIKVHIVTQLPVEAAIPIARLADQLSIFRNLSSRNAWTGHVRGSPSKWKAEDGAVIVQSVRDALTNPVIEDIPPGKLGKRPKVVPTKIGPVTVPGSEDSLEEQDSSTNPLLDPVKEPTSHTEIQWLLLKLGNDMGLDVWVARNDRSREYNGHRFSELPHIRAELPHQFDEATNRTIELIDILWLRAPIKTVTGGGSSR